MEFQCKIIFVFCYRTEKNATNWSKDKLKELLTGLTIENTEGKQDLCQFL